MHKSRSNRKANQERRDRQARRQSPLPLAVQQDRAEEHREIRHAQYERQGPEYARPSYSDKPDRRGPSFSKIVKDMGVDDLLFLPMLALARQLRKAV